MEVICEALEGGGQQGQEALRLLEQLVTTLVYRPSKMLVINAVLSSSGVAHCIFNGSNDCKAICRLPYVLRIEQQPA